MANSKRKITVTTDAGTFTRTTARTYSHLVVVGPMRAEWLEARRVRHIAEARKEIARYAAALVDDCATVKADERRRLQRAGLSAEYVAEWEATNTTYTVESFREFLAGSEATLATLEARGPFTADEGEPFCFAWCGRLDLARKQANTEQAAPYRWVRIFEVATGQEVR